jgi:hypothetical protein
MANVAELVEEHVTLTVDCIDRVYPRRLRARPAQLRRRREVSASTWAGRPVTRCFGQSTEGIRLRLRALTDEQGIP